MNDASKHEARKRAAQLVLDRMRGIEDSMTIGEFVGRRSWEVEDVELIRRELRVIHAWLRFRADGKMDQTPGLWQCPRCGRENPIVDGKYVGIADDGESATCPNCMAETRIY